METNGNNLLTLRGIRVTFAAARGEGDAVDRVDLDVREGERLGLVGESGSGKSTLLAACLGLIRPPGRVSAGSLRMADGREMAGAGEDEWRKVRLTGIALIPQAAMNALHPLMRIERQFQLAAAAHGRPMDSGTLGALFASVGLPPSVGRRFPHELSGGMKQRVCIAMAVSLRPRILLADEPTSALDVVVQQRVMQTLHRLHKQHGTSIVLVGHDMGLQAQFVDRIAVMYAGRIVEIGPAAEVFARPAHPYSRLLIESIPSFDRRGGAVGIPGVAPGLLDRPPGCAFHPRCPMATPECSARCPELRRTGHEHDAACHLAPGAAGGRS